MSEQWFKATRLDGTDFYTGQIDYAAALASGEPVMVTDPGGEFPGAGWLHASPVPTDCVGMRWPCRLFVVEPVGETTADDRKRGAHGLRVLEERPAHEALGPQGEHVAALIDRASRLTETEALELDAVWVTAWDAVWVTAWDAARYAAWDAARYAAWDAARYAAWVAAARVATRYAVWHAVWDATSDATRYAAWYATRYAAWYAARDAAWALLVRDLIAPEHYAALTGPWAKVIGPAHPEDGGDA